MAAPAQDLVYKGPEFDNSQFYGAFWAFDNGSKLDAGFDALKTLLGQGGDFLKEAASVLKERAQIEEQYAKSLEKLKAKAEKVGDNTYGPLKDSWSRLLKEFVDSAGWHNRISNLLRTRCCDKLLLFEKENKKELKARQQPVEKAYQQFNDECSSMLKSKRTAHAKSKDLETASQYVDEVQRNEAGKFGPKDASKAQKALAKAQAVRDKADEEYKASLKKLQLAQEDWETASISGFKTLQEWEVKRVLHLKTIFSDISHTYESLLKETEVCYKECVLTADNIDATQTIAAECDLRGTGPYVGHQQLYSILEENFDYGMDTTRRRNVLQTAMQDWQQEATRGRKTRDGLLKLWDATKSMHAERQNNIDNALKVKRQMVAHEYHLAALYATVFKLRTAVGSCTGERLEHTFTPMTSTAADDKLSMLHQSLRVPASWQLDAAALEAEEASLLQGVSSPAPIPGPPTPSSRPPMQQPPPPAPAAGRDDFSDDEFSSDEESAAPAVRNPHAGQAPPPPPPAQQAPVMGGAGGPPPPGPPPDLLATAPILPAPTPAAPLQAAPPAPAQAPPPVQQRPKLVEGLGLFRALYEYSPQEDDELELQEGDEVVLIEKQDEVWWRGTHQKTGKTGLFPAEYVESSEA
eukprot:m.147421 g.147421  ORF g.147421 m.147421 type:complete len:636 (-) comp16259_c0_seq8:96-2003(-)